jgi:hypothetical protein
MARHLGHPFQPIERRLPLREKFREPMVSPAALTFLARSDGALGR